MLIIGMTGGIGSGKSEALKIFESFNVKVIDLDKISKEITETNSDAIKEIKLSFGNTLFNEKNQLDRKKLKEIIFSSKEQKIKLESILHPKILNDVKKKLAVLSNETYIVIDIPLLFETNQYINFISRSLVIDCEIKNQIDRVKKRDEVDESTIQSVIANQIDRDARIKKGDDVVFNNGSLKMLASNIKKIHNKYLNLVVDKQNQPDNTNKN